MWKLEHPQARATLQRERERESSLLRSIPSAANRLTGSALGMGPYLASNRPEDSVEASPLTQGPLPDSH